MKISKNRLMIRSIRPNKVSAGIHLALIVLLLLTGMTSRLWAIRPGWTGGKASIWTLEIDITSDKRSRRHWLKMKSWLFRILRRPNTNLHRLIASMKEAGLCGILTNDTKRLIIDQIRALDNNISSLKYYFLHFNNFSNF